MWTDISNGHVAEPGKQLIILDKFIKPYLLTYLPVNENGDLVSPHESNIVVGRITEPMQGDFKFGDMSPVETAWRRSSYYSFSVIKAIILMAPSAAIGVLLDRSRISRNLTNQLIYSDTGVRINLVDIKIPSIYLSKPRVQTAGLINFLVNKIDCTTVTQYNRYKEDLKSIGVNIL